MRVVVTHLTGSHSGERQFCEDEQITIGRSRDSSVRLGINDTRASSRHAQLLEEGGHIVLVDVGSTNGTYLNGKKVERVRLKGGEAVEFGYGGPQLAFEFYELLPSMGPTLDEPHEFPFRAPYAWSLIALGALLVVVAVLTLVWQYILVAIPLGLVGFILFLLGVAAARKNITVGPDWIEFEGLFRTTRIKWTDVAALETVPRGTTMLSGPKCTVRGWKRDISFSPRDYAEGHLLAKVIAQASGKEWGPPGTPVQPAGPV